MTESLNMIQVPVDSVMLHHWAQTRGFTDLDHATHCLLTETFQDKAPRPYRMMLAANTKRANLLGYTQHSAQEISEAAKQHATQLVRRVINCNDIQEKPVPSDWQEGESLAFQVRLCPSRRAIKNKPDYTRLANTANPPNEQDAYLYHLNICTENQLTPKSGQEVYVEWLHERIAKQSGATLNTDSCQLRSYNKLQAQRKTNGPLYLLSEAVIAGSMTVTDPEWFQKILANGVGRHKAYGFGMIMLTGRA